MVKLYEQILQFEARAACHCNHNIAYQTFRNLFGGSSSWKDGLKAIQQAEAACASLLPTLDHETQSNSSKSLLEITARQNELIELSVVESQKLSQAIIEELKESRMVQEQAREAEEQRQCLATLRTTDYVGPKKLLPKKAAGTCEWFLQNPRYREWLKSDVPSLLWVTADPGCGKSVLTKSLVDEYLEVAGHASHVCYFFFRGGTEMESPSAALCAMLHQLFCQDEGLLNRHGLPQYQQNGSKLATLFEPLWEMFTKIYQDPDRDELVCVVDALDECDPSQKTVFMSRLAEMISDQDCKPVKAKFLVTSRPDRSLRNTLFDVFGSTPFDLLQINGDNRHETNTLVKEINLVIGDNIARFKRTRVALSIHDNIHEELQKRIFEVENRTYLWVSIVFQDLQAKAGSSKEDVLLTLRTLPTKVETAYEKCLDRVPPAEVEDAKKILRIILSAARDLNLEELKIAFTVRTDGSYQQLNVSDATSIRIFADTVRHLCGLLVRIEGPVVSLIHQTARDFLIVSLDSPRMLLHGWEHSFSPVQSNTTLAECCIWYLNSPTFDEEWMKRREGKWKASGFGAYLKLHPLVEYAAKYWTFHLNLSSAIAGDDLCADAVKLCKVESSRYRTWSKIYWNSFFGRRAPSQTIDLSVAVAYDMVEVITELVRGGYNINSQDGDGDTALHAAALHSCENAATCLIRHQASTTIKANDGNTPLHSAAAKGATSIVKLIIDHGGNLEEVNNQGRTPLHRASLFGHPEAVKILLASGAKINAQDQRGRTALHLVAVLGEEDIKSRRRLYFRGNFYATFNMLMQSGANHTITDEDNMTAGDILGGSLTKSLDNVDLKTAIEDEKLAAEFDRLQGWMTWRQFENG